MGIFDLFKPRKKEVVWNQQMEVLFCFLGNTFSCADMLYIMEQSEEFKISAVSRERDFVMLTSEIHNDLQEEKSNESRWQNGLIFLDQHNERRVFFQSASNNEKTQAVFWVFDSFRFFESALFKKLIAHPNFIAAFCFNSEDDLYQNLTSLDYYERKGIKPVATRKNQWGQEEVDIDKNPGRTALTELTWVKSSWKNWFGKNFYKLVDKERILRFDKAYSINELDNSVISVQLYENPAEFDDINNRQIQMSFKEWLGF